MSRQQHALLVVLTILVVALLAHSIVLHRRLAALSARAEIKHLRVNAIELVQPDGDVVGSFTAGHAERSPKIKLKQEGDGHYCTIGIAANGTGPYLDMLCDFDTGNGPETRIQLGAFDSRLHGLQIEGRNASAWPPITLGWVTERVKTNGQRYVHSIPGKEMK